MGEEIRIGSALAAAEAALAEDVILALGNIRAGLRWFGVESAAGTGEGAAPRGVERLDRQIAGVEAGARRIGDILHDQLARAARDGSADDAADDAPGGTQDCALPLFVSRRR